LLKTRQTEEFWQAFTRHASLAGADYVVVAPGDNPDIATELAALVVSGVKRATASLVRDFSSPDNPLPRVGDFVVIVDGIGNPQCIYRTTEIEIKPLIAADERFAWDEGEGDRTLDWWLAAHRRYLDDRRRGTASRCTMISKPSLSASRSYGRCHSCSLINISGATSALATFSSPWNGGIRRRVFADLFEFVPHGVSFRTLSGG